MIAWNEWCGDTWDYLFDWVFGRSKKDAAFDGKPFQFTEERN